MINLSFSNGNFFVWNVEDIYILRKEHHIVGSLVGCFPSKPFQNLSKWLPLQLMPEEAKLLLEKGIAQLVSSPDEVPDQSVVEAYYERRKKLCEEQVILMKERRKQEILEKADEIYEGKKRKLLGESSQKKKIQTGINSQDLSVIEAHSVENSNLSIQDHDVVRIEDQNSNSATEQVKKPESELVEDSDFEKTIVNPVSCLENDSCTTESIHLDKNTVIEDELCRVSDLPIDQCLVELFTECPWKKSTSDVRWKYPLSESERLRYAVFKDLWEKDFYITTASKFGGDFLAYEGDPLKYHALYIVVCIPSSARLQAIDLLVYGRLGNQVKKTVALASVNEKKDVEYISLNWAQNLHLRLTDDA